MWPGNFHVVFMAKVHFLIPFQEKEGPLLQRLCC